MVPSEVILSVAEEPVSEARVTEVGAAGAVVSIVVVKAVDAAPWLPAASVARAVSEADPPGSAEVVKVQPALVAVVVPRAVMPL